MAIKLENKVNTEAPSATYPFGNIKDNTGSNNGTPVDKNVYADFHQFFAKMMFESGIVYNDLPDNNTDGFQYWLALLENIKKTASFYTDITGTISVHPILTSPTVVCHDCANGFVMIRINATISANIIASSQLLSGLPIGAGGQNIIGFLWLSSITGNRTPTSFAFNVDTISNTSQINVATFDRINIYLVYKKE